MDLVLGALPGSVRRRIWIAWLVMMLGGVHSSSAQTSGVYSGHAGAVAKSLWRTCTAGQVLVKDTSQPYGVACAANGSGTGDVVGPASAVDGGVALFNGTTGKLIKDGGALGTNVLTWLGTPSSANLAAALTDETGTGAAVFGTGPTITAPMTLTGVVGSSALTISGATQTASFPVIDATQTWNNAATTFTGLKFNATDTASAAGSLLADLQLAGATRFKVQKDGVTTITSTPASGVVLTLTSQYGSTNFTRSGASVSFSNDLILSGTAGYLELNVGGGNNSRLYTTSTGFDIANGSNPCTTASNCRDVRLRHLIASGTAPTIDTGCGTGTLATGASDAAGKITTNTTGACTIVLTFGVAWPRAPSCSVNNETTANLSRSTTTTTTATLTGTTVTGDVWSYHCVGY